jgi:uncharacterized protein
VTPYAETIGANGKVFSCTEHPLVPKHEAKDTVGNLIDSPTEHRLEGRFDKFNAKDISKLPCSSCLFIGLCGGACPKHWEENHPPCPSFK